MSEELFFKVEKTARVHTHGNLSAQTKRIWLVFHGYAQLSTYFIKHFEHLNPQEHFVIAPEALSRTYINGMSGRVGASWMTKESRETEIEDYLNYINKVFDSLTNSININEIEIVVLGFSQGAATASRWASKNNSTVNLLVLWAGQPAKELISNKFFQNLPIIFVTGSKDPYISREFMQELTKKLEDFGWQFKLKYFEGEHRLDKKVVSILANEAIR